MIIPEAIIYAVRTVPPKLSFSPTPIPLSAPYRHGQPLVERAELLPPGRVDVRVWARAARLRLQPVVRGEAVSGVDARRQPGHQPRGRQQGRRHGRQLEPVPRLAGCVQVGGGMRWKRILFKGASRHSWGKLEFNWRIWVRLQYDCLVMKLR